MKLRDMQKNNATLHVATNDNTLSLNAAPIYFTLPYPLTSLVAFWNLFSGPDALQKGRIKILKYVIFLLISISPKRCLFKDLD